MQANFTLSQVEKSSFSALAEAGGWRRAFVALLAYKGVSTGELAKALGVSPSMVSKVKSGRDMSKGIVVQLRRLNVPEDLLPRADYLRDGASEARAA